MSEKQFIVEKLEILNDENDFKGEYWWAVTNTERIEDCFECRNKEVALKLCAFLNKSSDDFKWQIRQCEKCSAIVKQLREENEQWKKEYKIAINEMVTDYKKLEKENEMLRILLKDIYVDDELRKLAERYGVENE